jgi:hypothetical protein
LSFTIPFIFVCISAAAVPLFVFLLRKYSIKLALVGVVALIIEAILASFYTVYAFGGAFGPGFILYCISPLVTLFSLTVLVFPRSFPPTFNQDWRRRTFYWVAGLLIVSLQLCPFVGSYFINFNCYVANQVKAEEMIAALEAYRQDQGQYPEELETLIPTYLPSLPTPACGSLSGDSRKPEFDLEQCRFSGETLLTLKSVDSSSIQRYNFATGNWSSTSLFEGTCSFLR